MSVRGVGNAIVLRILGSPCHRLLSGSVAAVEYEGRRSGRRVRLPVQYATLDSQIVVSPAHAEGKQWWRNFEQPRRAIVRIAGRTCPVVGEVVRGVGPDDPFVIAYRHRFPKARDLDLIVLFKEDS